MTAIMVMLAAAATMTVGLQKAATLMTGQQKLVGAQSESALANLAPEEKERRLAERERMGENLMALFGFAFGEDFASYKFETTSTNAYYMLPQPVFGFTEFIPFVTEEKLCGLYLKRPAQRDEDDRFSPELFVAEREMVRTNLAATLAVKLDNLSIATNGVPHVWRISFEQWCEALALRICDEERIHQLLVEAERRRKAEEAARRAAALQKAHDT